MTRNKDILNELEQISQVVAKLNPVVPYQVPEVYFDTLAPVIMARIAAGGQEENSLLQVAGKEMPQAIPAGYFDTLSESILEKIKAQPGQTVADELAGLSPLLSGISKTNVYEVPSGYFNTVADTVNAQLQPTAKVVSLFSRKNILRFAAAAVVLSMLAFGINFLLQQQSNSIAFIIAKVEPINTQKQFNKELAALSDDAIVNYLQLTADTKDVEKISESIDQTQLPEETDYMDEEFLENFMKELEKTEKQTTPAVEVQTETE
nr:hypothetical protein [uncultured Lacibacter sp.]